MNLTKFITEVSCPVCGRKLHSGQINRTGSKTETLTFKPLPKYDCPNCGSGLRLVERKNGFLRFLLTAGAFFAFFGGTIGLSIIGGYPGGGVFGFIVAFISLLLFVLGMRNINVVMVNWNYRVEVVE